MKSALVLGSTGLLGSHVAARLKERYRVVGTRRRHQPPFEMDSCAVDITSYKEIEDLIKNGKFDLVINCIGETNIEDCDFHPESAWQVNATLPYYLAKATLISNSRFIHISTDHFYSEEQRPRAEEVKFTPINHYGNSKFAGDNFVTELNPTALVIRTNFFGLAVQNKNSLLNFLSKKILAQDHIIGFDDVIFNPLGVAELSRIILRLADSNISGILHTAGPNPVTKYEFSKLVASTLDNTSAEISRGSIKSLGLKVKRPNYLALDGTKLRVLLGISVPSLESMLREELGIKV